MALVSVYAFGAYGTNNVGDEAIFEGIRRVHPQVRQIYINKSNKPNAVWYGSLNEPSDFDPGSHLIIGGGGLLYSEHAIQTMIKLVGLCRANGGTATVEGLGCEAYRPAYAHAARTLFSMVSGISVRTNVSAEIVRGLGFPCEVRPDFAFNLADLFGQRGTRSDRLQVGLILSGDAFGDDFDPMRRLIRKHTVGPDAVEFVHIPHSRSFVDIHNNDEIVGERIWSSIHIDHSLRTALYSSLPYTNDIAKMAARYSTLDAVVSQRFHGIIFSIMSRLPVLVNAANPKNMSVVADNPDAPVFRFEGEEGLFARFEEMIATVRAR